MKKILLMLLFTAAANAQIHDGALTVTPAVITLRGAFGQSTTQRLSITNGTSRELTFDVFAQDVVVRTGKRDAAPRYAVLRASLINADANITIRIDGITLGAMPVVIDTHAAIGATTPHRIEIEIPADAPEGALLTSIGWEAVTP